MVVETVVGYSVDINRNCSLDGAATKTTYFVDDDAAHLVSIDQNVTDRRTCW